MCVSKNRFRISFSSSAESNQNGICGSLSPIKHPGVRPILRSQSDWRLPIKLGPRRCSTIVGLLLAAVDTLRFSTHNGSGRLASIVREARFVLGFLEDGAVEEDLARRRRRSCTSGISYRGEYSYEYEYEGGVYRASVNVAIRRGKIPGEAQAGCKCRYVRLPLTRPLPFTVCFSLFAHNFHTSTAFTHAMRCGGGRSRGK